MIVAMADITQATDPVTDKVVLRAVSNTAREWMCDQWGEPEVKLDAEDAQDFLEEAAENGFDIAAA